MFTNAKLALYGGIVVLIIALGFGLHYLYKDNQELVKDNAIITHENKVNTEIIAKKEESDKINDDIQTEVLIEHEKTEQVFEDIRTEKDKKVAAIRNNKPTTFKDGKDAQLAAEIAIEETEEDRLIASAEIDALWVAFCVVEPKHPQCLKEEPK